MKKKLKQPALPYSAATAFRSHTRGQEATEQPLFDFILPFPAVISILVFSLTKVQMMKLAKVAAKMLLLRGPWAGRRGRLGHQGLPLGKTVFTV